jgi:hypothetical protein
MFHLYTSSQNASRYYNEFQWSNYGGVFPYRSSASSFLSHSWAFKFGPNFLFRRIHRLNSVAKYDNCNVSTIATLIGKLLVAFSVLQRSVTKPHPFFENLGVIVLHLHVSLSRIAAEQLKKWGFVIRRTWTVKGSNGDCIIQSLVRIYGVL